MRPGRIAIAIAIALVTVLAGLWIQSRSIDPSISERDRFVGVWNLHTDAPCSRQMVLREDGTGSVSDSELRGGPREIASWSVDRDERVISIVMARPEVHRETEIGGPYQLKTKGKRSGLVLTHTGGDAPGRFAYIKEDE